MLTFFLFDTVFELASLCCRPSPGSGGRGGSVVRSRDVRAAWRRTRWLVKFFSGDIIFSTSHLVERQIGLWIASVYLLFPVEIHKKTSSGSNRTRWNKKLTGAASWGNAMRLANYASADCSSAGSAAGSKSEMPLETSRLYH